MSNFGTSEHDHYKDEGCEESPTCLACPHPICKYDSQIKWREYKRGVFDSMIMAEVHQGIRHQDIANKHGVHVRTIGGIIARMRVGA